MIGSKLHISKKATAACSGIVAIAIFLGPAIALAEDGVAGKQIFATHCAACHAVTPGGGKIGPSLAGVYERPSGSIQGFNYSPALKKAQLTWDSATLDKWLQNPSRVVRGTTMFATVPSSTDRKRLIAYLKTLSGDEHALAK
jgi:cytochrome c2